MSARPKPKKDARIGQFVPNGAAAKGGLNKSIHDAGWGAFVQICRSKAEEAGSTVVLVAPHDTSKMCSGCSRDVPKDLDERWHSCPHCGLELDRDHNLGDAFSAVQPFMDIAKKLFFASLYRLFRQQGKETGHRPS